MLGGLGVGAALIIAPMYIAEISPALPHCPGEDNAMHLSEVTHLIDGGDIAPPELAAKGSTGICGYGKVSTSIIFKQDIWEIAC